jgi:hypothetical protein
LATSYRRRSPNHTRPPIVFPLAVVEDRTLANVDAPELNDPAAPVGRGRLRQLLAYGKKVYGLDELLGRFRDRRRRARVSSRLVARIVFLLGLLRVRSFNAFDPKLAEPWMQRALGLTPGSRKACSVDAVTYALQRAEVSTARDGLVELVRKAERNKVFREGWYGAMRFVGIDGWEPFSSYKRHCSACLSRQVTVGKEVCTQYYHQYVVALMLGERLELVLEFEPILSADAKRERGQKNVEGHEGELTAAKRLVRRLRTTYGRWLDVLVCDALYSNGPFFTVAQQCGYGVVAVVKKETDEPFREALALWGQTPPQQTVEDAHKKERIELWDCPDLRTLMTYDGDVRVVRAVVHKGDSDKTSRWCLALTGKAMKLSPERAIRIGRARWHLENTGFCQWTKYWRFSHVFTHGKDALPTLFYFFFLAFNLLQLFVYRQIGGYGRDRGTDVTRTLWRLVDEMLGDLERLDELILWDTS